MAEDRIPGGDILPRSDWHKEYLLKNKAASDKQLEALLRRKRKEKAEESLEGKYYGRLGRSNMPGDYRFAQVLSSIYDDPFLKMLIKAAQADPSNQG